jgi:alkanesulfonate monooxygenase SsuD/methylene tetrahydromethanopterin reductase-like flavin-dependent oxidoreductase (luciferase family)
VKFAIHAPNFGTYSDPRALAELAREAEDAGWDGFFLWDHILWKWSEDGPYEPAADTWTLLTAIAARTERITIGPLITPLPRRRPWTVARQAATLDHLSGGRVVLGVGIGGDWFGDYSAFGEPADSRAHGEMLDEALTIIAGLWSGEPFSFSGAHYTVREAQLVPPPVQRRRGVPGIPIWVAGNWPNKKPFRRAARWDGVAAEARDDFGHLKPEHIREITAYIREHRESEEPFDVTHIGRTPGDDPASLRSEATAIVAPYADAGVTWWLERIGDRQDTLEQARPRVRQGPPAIG